jgi:hypothetical protein
MTLSTNATAFKTLLDPAHRIMTLGGGVVIVASETQGLFKAVVNSASTASMPLAFTNLPTGTVYQFNVALNAAGTRVGVMAEAPSPASSQIYDCVLGTLTCTAAGSAFGFSLFGAAASAANYYFPNGTGQAIEYVKFGGPYTFQSLASPTQPSGFIALDATSAYWLTTNALERSLLTGGGIVDVVTSFPANTGNYSDLATDGRNVYYTAFGSPAYIAYAPVGAFPDKSAKVIASLSDASAVAAAGGKVFWIDGTTIYGMAAP